MYESRRVCREVKFPRNSGIEPDRLEFVRSRLIREEEEVNGYLDKDIEVAGKEEEVEFGCC
mgnify:CR=1 FL=1